MSRVSKPDLPRAVDRPSIAAAVPEATSWLGRVTDALIQRVGVLPTTSLRIVVTLVLVFATGGVYLVLAAKVALFGLDPTTAAQRVAEIQWEPSGTWLAFLAGMSGLDAITFAAKRATAAEYVAAKTSGVAPVPPPDPATIQ